MGTSEELAFLCPDQILFATGKVSSEPLQRWPGPQFMYETKNRIYVAPRPGICGRTLTILGTRLIFFPGRAAEVKQTLHGLHSSAFRDDIAHQLCHDSIGVLVFGCSSARTTDATTPYMTPSGYVIKSFETPRAKCAEMYTINTFL